MQKEWTVLNPNPKGELVESIIRARGIKDMVHFLRPREIDMLPYEDLSNIGQAAEIVLKAIKDNKRIHILFDPDNDGCCSGAIEYRYLRNFTERVTWSINVGKKHGLNMEDLPSYIGKYDLVIAVDSSSKSYEEQKFLTCNNIQVICLDHHPTDLSKCSAIVVNSQLNGYKNPALAGAGVVFKFVKYLDILQGTNYADEFWDLATSGIIGDMQDVSEDSMENRYICSMGFKNLKNPGIKEIIGNYQFNGTSVVYSISPILNAGVRTKHGKLSSQILLEDDKKIIQEMLSDLKTLKEVQNIQKDALVKKIDSEIEEKHLNNQKVMGFIIEYKDEGLQADITGLAANVISTKYDSLVIIVHPTKENGILRGSIRGNGVPNFKGLINKTNLAIFCEGHNGAAGISILESNFQKLIDVLNEKLKDVELKLYSQIDVILEPSDISLLLIKKLEYINTISGTGFKPITIMMKNLEPEKTSKMKNIHSKFEAKDMEFIKWNSDLSTELECSEGIYKVIDVCGVLGTSTFRGRTKRQLIINDYKIDERLEFFR